MYFTALIASADTGETAREPALNHAFADGSSVYGKTLCCVPGPEVVLLWQHCAMAQCSPDRKGSVRLACMACVLLLNPHSGNSALLPFLLPTTDIFTGTAKHCFPTQGTKPSPSKQTLSCYT